MAAKYILALLAAVFLAASVWRMSRENFKPGPASRTWLLVAVIFGLVSGWLWWSGTSATG